MPEIVEVNWFSNYLNTYRNNIFKSVKSISTKYKTADFAMLDNLILSQVKTHGKLLWFEFFDTNLILVCHFGLHGLFSHVKSNSSKIEIELEDVNKIKTMLYFNIKFNGSIQVITRDMLELKLRKLGDDLFKTKIDSTILLNRIKIITKNGKKNLNKKLVTVLLEQSKSGIGSGIGNYLVAEIMYDAKLSPHTTMTELLVNEDKVKSLATSIIKIIRWSYLTSMENYFKKIDKKILDYVVSTRLIMPLEYDYYSEVNINDLGVFSCRVYKKTIDPNGVVVKKERIVGERECYWVDN